MQLSQKSIKKSGKNSFQNYEYFELGDFLNPLNELMNTNGVMTQFVLQDKRAVLHVINSDKPEEKVTFYTPTAVAEGKGTNAIQQLGSQITYLRRYLFMIAFEIAESDSVDNQEPDNNRNTPTTPYYVPGQEKMTKTTNTTSQAQEVDENRKDWCSIHNKQMKERTAQNGGHYFDHRWQENGEWQRCNGKPKLDQEEQEYPSEDEYGN